MKYVLLNSPEGRYNGPGRLLKIVVSDDDSIEPQTFVGIPDDPPREPERRLARKYSLYKPPAPSIPQSGSLDNLSTAHISTPFDPDLLDPTAPAPWYDLNWSLMASLRRNQGKLTQVQRYYLQHIDERVRDFPKSFGRADTGEDDYSSVACMIAMACSRAGNDDRDASTDLSFQDRFCRCCRITYKTKQGDIFHNGVCEVRRFCRYCNYRVRQEALLTYVPAFNQGRWYAMTISSTPELDVDIDELTYAWDAGKAVVHALVKAGIFQGAYWTEELSLNALYPETRVNPHVHVIFQTGGVVDVAGALAFAQQTFKKHFANLRRKFARWRKHPLKRPFVPYEDDLDASVNLQPSLRLDELGTKADLYRACDYLTKTVRIVDAYKNALDAVGDDERWEVNERFEQFLSGLTLFLEEDSPRKKKRKRERQKVGEPVNDPDTQSDPEHQARKTEVRPDGPRPMTRRQRHYLGTLKSGRNRHFVGIRPPERHLYRAELYELRREIIAQRAASSLDESGPDTVEQ